MEAGYMCKDTIANVFQLDCGRDRTERMAS